MKNYVLLLVCMLSAIAASAQYCMASNISGVIGSAVAAGVLISFLG